MASPYKHACEDVAMIEIERLRPDDRDAWERLARGYTRFSGFIRYAYPL
jgi:hypothetical protein